MKDIKDKINEGKDLVIACAFNDLVDEEGLSISCRLIVDSKYAKEVAEFGKKEEANIFQHFDDDANVCY